jgi:hypothetical protein
MRREVEAGVGGEEEVGGVGGEGQEEGEEDKK